MKTGKSQQKENGYKKKKISKELLKKLKQISKNKEEYNMLLYKIALIVIAAGAVISFVKVLNEMEKKDIQVKENGTRRNL